MLAKFVVPFSNANILSHSILLDIREDGHVKYLIHLFFVL